MSREFSNELDQIEAMQTGEDVARSDDSPEYGFENGAPVPTVRPDEPAPTFQEIVADLIFKAVEDWGVADTISAQVDDLAREYFRASATADSPTAGALIAARLENAPLAKTVAGRAYIRVLQGDNKPSFSEDADRLGVSKEAVRKSELATREALFG